MERVTRNGGKECRRRGGREGGVTNDRREDLKDEY